MTIRNIIRDAIRNPHRKSIPGGGGGGGGGGSTTPANALANRDGSLIVNRDGSYIIADPTPRTE